MVMEQAPRPAGSASFPDPNTECTEATEQEVQNGCGLPVLDPRRPFTRKDFNVEVLRDGIKRLAR